MISHGHNCDLNTNFILFKNVIYIKLCGFIKPDLLLASEKIKNNVF